MRTHYGESQKNDTTKFIILKNSCIKRAEELKYVDKYINRRIKQSIQIEIISQSK